MRLPNELKLSIFTHMKPITRKHIASINNEILCIYNKKLTRKYLFSMDETTFQRTYLCVNTIEKCIKMFLEDMWLYTLTNRYDNFYIEVTTDCSVCDSGYLHGDLYVTIVNREDMSKILNIHCLANHGMLDDVYELNKNDETIANITYLNNFPVFYSAAHINSSSVSIKEYRSKYNIISCVCHIANVNDSYDISYIYNNTSAYYIEIIRYIESGEVSILHHNGTYDIMKRSIRIVFLSSY